MPNSFSLPSPTPHLPLVPYLGVNNKRGSCPSFFHDVLWVRKSEKAFGRATGGRNNYFRFLQLWSNRSEKVVPFSLQFLIWGRGKADGRFLSFISRSRRATFLVGTATRRRRRRLYGLAGGAAAFGTERSPMS